MTDRSRSSPPRRRSATATRMLPMTADAVRNELREEAEYEGSQRALARLIGVSPTLLNDILLSKREPSGKVLEFLGYERVITYRRL